MEPSNKQIQRQRMMRYFIKAAAELLEEEGIENITIRKVANRAAYNSATLYNYFEGLDHLIFFALIKYTRNYVLALSEAIRPELSPYQVYLRTWECFCLHAFQNPQCFYRLFFTQKDGMLSRALREYYDLFPEELQNQSPMILDMLCEADIFARNHKLLRATVPEGEADDRRISTVNSLVIYAFQGLLYDELHQRDQRTPQQLTRDMMEMVRLAGALLPASEEPQE